MVKIVNAVQRGEKRENKGSLMLGGGGGGPRAEAGLLVEVGLGLLALNGCVETVDVFLRMEPLCVLNRIVGLQTDRTWESQPKQAT